MTQGILFVAVGWKYIRSAMRAAETVRCHCPGLPIHLFANWKESHIPLEQIDRVFTSMEEIPDPHSRSKVDYLHLTPFEQTLYLDNDTALNTDIRDMFQVLERFDIGLCHAHWRNIEARLKSWRIELPQAFPQFNSGVILYRKSPAVLQLLQNWQQAYSDAGIKEDQRTLRELLWESDVRIATLPPEYNVRFIKYLLMWTRSEAVSKIYHLRRYQEGRLWFVKAWARRLGRGLIRAGIDPRKWIRKGGG